MWSNIFLPRCNVGYAKYRFVLSNCPGWILNKVEIKCVRIEGLTMNLKKLNLIPNIVYYLTMPADGAQRVWKGISKSPKRAAVVRFE